MQRTLYNGHLPIPLTLPPTTELSIINTFNRRYFLQETCMHFTLDNVLQFRLSFLRSLLFYFLTSLMVFSEVHENVGICSDFQSVFISMVDMFSSCKDVQKAMGQGLKYRYNPGDFCCTWTTTSLLQ